MNHKFLLLFLVYIISLFHCVPRVLGTPIIGGSIYHDDSFKYQVSLHKINLETNTYELFCGGTIIHLQYILTAANCFIIKISDLENSSIKIEAEKPRVIAGSNRKRGPGIEGPIVTIFIPLTYEYYPNSHGDVAVAKLSKDLKSYDDGYILGIMPLGRLPPNQEKVQAKFCGYGYYELERNSAGILEPLKVFSDIILCLSVKLSDEHRCPPSQICSVTSDSSNIHTACHGDQGAGLIYEDAIVGVFSHGPENCNTNEFPMKFTRLFLFEDFIHSAVHRGGDSSSMHILKLKQPVPSRRHNEESSSRRG